MIGYTVLIMFNNVAMSSFEKFNKESKRRDSLFYKLVFSRLLIEIFTIGSTLTFRVYDRNLIRKLLFLKLYLQPPPVVHAS